MKVGILVKGFKNIFMGLFWVLIAFFIYSSHYDVVSSYQIEDSIDLIPNHNYVPEIIKLKREGKTNEALEITRFVRKHPDIPGQDSAKELEIMLEEVLNSAWERTGRVGKGFVTGSGDSIEELSGAIASDMLIYGDIRDLVKQGYFKIMGEETDPLIVALSSLGLATEFADCIDWAPAVLKVFRKLKLLSNKFTEFLITAIKKSIKGLKLDDLLKTVLENLKLLIEKLDFARTAAVIKYVDTPSDIIAITAVAEKNADAAYFTIKNGGTNGVKLIKDLGTSEDGVSSLLKAAKKGPSGIEWLRKGGSGQKSLGKIRKYARIFKNICLGRPQQLITALWRNYPGIVIVLLSCVLLFALRAFLRGGRTLYGLKK